MRHGVVQEGQQSKTGGTALQELLSASGKEPTSQTVSHICTAAALISGDCVIADTWKETESHLLAASSELSKVQSVLLSGSTFCDTIEELHTLEELSKARAHLGMALSLVFCPSVVDPVMLARAEYLFHSQLVRLSVYIII